MLCLWKVQAQGRSDRSQVDIMTTKEGELAVYVGKFFTDAAHQRISQIDSSTMSGVEQTVMHLLDTADGTPLFLGQFMTKGCHILTLIALKHEGIRHAVGQFETARQLWFVALFKCVLRIIEAEMDGIVGGSRRMGHVDYFLHQCQCGLHALHPSLRTAMQSLHFSKNLLAILIVHFRELSLEHGIHLVLVVLMLNLHIGKRQETC